MVKLCQDHVCLLQYVQCCSIFHGKRTNNSVEITDTKKCGMTCGINKQSRWLWDVVSTIWKHDTEEEFGSSRRHKPCKVTFGIWAVTHSSARERLGYMLLWKCTSCMIILYSRLNGVHPILYLVNMSHLICVYVCVSAASRPRVLRVRTQRDPVNVDSILYVHVCTSAPVNAEGTSVFVKAYPSLHLTHLGPPRVGRAAITGETPHVSACRIQTAANLGWQRSAEEISPWNIKQKLPWRWLLFIYAHISNQRLIKCGTSAAALSVATPAPCTQFNHKHGGMGLLRRWVYWG